MTLGTCTTEEALVQSSLGNKFLATIWDRAHQEQEFDHLQTSSDNSGRENPKRLGDRGVGCTSLPFFMFRLIKFTAPWIDDTHVRWRDKIAKIKMKWKWKTKGNINIINWINHEIFLFSYINYKIINLSLIYKLCVPLSPIWWKFYKTCKF